MCQNLLLIKTAPGKLGFLSLRKHGAYVLIGCHVMEGLWGSVWGILAAKSSTVSQQPQGVEQEREREREETTYGEEWWWWWW